MWKSMDGSDEILMSTFMRSTLVAILSYWERRQYDVISRSPTLYPT